MRLHLVFVLLVLRINGLPEVVLYNVRNVLVVIRITLVQVTVLLALQVLTLMREDPALHVLIILFLMVLLVNVLLALQEQKELQIIKLVTFVQEMNIQTVLPIVFLALLGHTP